MKLAVISDIHGNLPALDAVYEDIQQYDIDAIICCGDITGIIGWSSEVIDRLREWNVITVIGNHDVRMLPETVYKPSYAICRDEHRIQHENLLATDVAWLNGLPERISTEEYVVAHCWPTRYQDNDKSITGFNTEDFGVTPGRITQAGPVAQGRFVFLGHTHEQNHLCVDKFQGQSGTVLNPGSVGEPWNKDANYSLVDTETGNITHRAVPYPTEKVKNKLESLIELKLLTSIDHVR